MSFCSAAFALSWPAQPVLPVNLFAFFPENAHENAFVAENGGGWGGQRRRGYFNGELTKVDFQTVVEHLPGHADVEIIAQEKTAPIR